MILRIREGVRAFKTARRLGYSRRDSFIAARLFALQPELVQAVLLDRFAERVDEIDGVARYRRPFRGMVR